MSIVDKVTGEVRRRGRIRVVVPKGRVKVKSEFKDQCDINKIVKRMQRTGDYSPLNLERSWRETDISGMPTNFTDACEIVRNISDKFASLSSKDRLKYNNDPNLWYNDLVVKRQEIAERVKADKAARAAKISEAASKAPSEPSTTEAEKPK